MSDGQLILVAGGLLAAGWLASLLAERYRLPALVLFLGVGMAIGSDGFNLIHFEDYELARFVGVATAAVILFEAGLASGFAKIRPVLRPAISLALVGTFGTAAITGAAAMWLFDFSLLQGLLVGAILAATDGPAVFALLRAVDLRPRVAAALEGETGMVDPVAVLLVVACIELIDTPGFGALEIVELFARELSIGAVVGIAAGWLGRQALRRSAGMPDSLHLVGSIAIVALSFGGAATLHGSGFLAAYLAGLVFASGELPARRSILAFHEGLASVADIALFLALGLLVFPSQLGSIAVEGTLLALILAFVARPAAAALATAFESFDARERIVIGWAGLRGALPVFLATFPVTAGIPRSVEFFNIVFFAVLVSTLIQGATVEPLARRLGVTATGVGSGAHGRPAPAGAS
jgi:cell volume regulation protein A